MTYARSGHRPSIFTAAPVASEYFKKLGKHVFASVWRGSNRLPVYRYKTGVTSSKCFKECKKIFRCIGLTFRAKDKTCFLFLNEKLYRLNGWYEGGTVTGTVPSQLKRGRREGLHLGLVSFVKVKGISLATNSEPYNELKDMESSVASEQITQSPIPQVSSPEGPKRVKPGTEGMMTTSDESQEYEPPEISTLSPLEVARPTQPPMMKGPMQPEDQTPMPLPGSDAGNNTDAPHTASPAKSV